MEPGALNLACTDAYQAIWHHTIQYGTPPAAADVADQLALLKWEWKQVLDKLRSQGRIHYGSLMPTAYATWQRHQWDAENHSQRSAS